LFFLVLSGLFSGSIIQVSGNHIIQLKQLATAYEAKSALNMSKQILNEEIKTNEIPKKAAVDTSLGDVSIVREETDEVYTFTLTLTTTAGTEYSDNLEISIPEPEGEPEEELKEDTEEGPDEKPEEELEEETEEESEKEPEEELEEELEEEPEEELEEPEEEPQIEEETFIAP